MIDAGTTLTLADGVPGRPVEPSSTPSGPDWVLRDVSFTIEPGETVAIVGHTGAGKTTIISLLMRFYDVQKGAIKIDGVDIKEMDLADLRRRFGVVLQDPFLFTGTVASNIRLGTEGIEDEDVEKAAEDVNLADFIRTLPNGFQRRGPRARQHAFDRPKTAHLICPRPGARSQDPDPRRSHLQRGYGNRIPRARCPGRMVEGRTSVIIAHRLSTIQRADKIIVMHKGQVREMGTHQQLLAQRGIYYKLYQLQYKDQEVAASPQVTAGRGRLADQRFTGRTGWPATMTSEFGLRPAVLERRALMSPRAPNGHHA